MYATFLPCISLFLVRLQVESTSLSRDIKRTRLIPLSVIIPEKSPAHFDPILVQFLEIDVMHSEHMNTRRIIFNMNHLSSIWEDSRLLTYKFVLDLLFDRDRIFKRFPTIIILEAQVPKIIHWRYCECVHNIFFIILVSLCDMPSIELELYNSFFRMVSSFARCSPNSFTKNKTIVNEYKIRE